MGLPKCRRSPRGASSRAWSEGKTCQSTIAFRPASEIVIQTTGFSRPSRVMCATLQANPSITNPANLRTVKPSVNSTASSHPSGWRDNERPPFFVTQLRHLGSRRDLLRSVVLRGRTRMNFASSMYATAAMTLPTKASTNIGHACSRSPTELRRGAIALQRHAPDQLGPAIPTPPAKVDLCLLSIWLGTRVAPFERRRGDNPILAWS
jgi:hypothetical protein